MTPITIRNLGPDDAHVLDHVKAGTFETLDLSRAWALLATRVNEMVVALDRGQVIGFVYGTMQMRPDASGFVVNNIAVHPQYRRQGIATRLMRRMIDLATDRGCVDLWILTDSENKDAQAFFDALDGARSAKIAFDWTL